MGLKWQNKGIWDYERKEIRMKLLNVKVNSINNIDTSEVQSKISGLQSNLDSINRNISYSGEKISKAIQNSSEKLEIMLDTYEWITYENQYLETLFIELKKILPQHLQFDGNCACNTIYDETPYDIDKVKEILKLLELSPNGGNEYYYFKKDRANIINLKVDKRYMEEARYKIQNEIIEEQAKIIEILNIDKIK